MPEGTAEYRVTGIEGDAHNQEFTVCVNWKNGISSQGKGSSRRGAEQQAARKALELLEESGVHES